MAGVVADDPLARAFGDRKRQLQAAAMAATARLWTRTVGDPSDAAAAAWVEAWSPLRDAAIAQSIVLTSAYVDGYLDARGITPGVTDIDVDDIATRIRPSVSTEQVAMRPVQTVRHKLSEGIPLTQALEQGGQRVASIVSTDVQQAHRVAFAERSDAEPSISAYRRVTTGDENCALCVIASTQRYHAGDLMPIHPGCQCTVEPIVGRVGQVIDQQTLDEVKALLDDEDINYGNRAAVANTRVRVNVKSINDVTEVQHGELGPILAVGRHRNVDVSDLPRWVRRSRREFGPSETQRRHARQQARQRRAQSGQDAPFEEGAFVRQFREGLARQRQ